MGTCSPCSKRFIKRGRGTNKDPKFICCATHSSLPLVYNRKPLPYGANLRRLTYLTLLLSLLLGSCRPHISPVVNEGKATTPPTPTNTKTRLSLKPCTASGIKAECGTLRVPEDRNNPNGRILDLSIVVVPAREANSEPDPLFYVAGGPGTAATGTGYINNVHTIFWEINGRRKVVFLDQRGTNDKHHLTCEWPSFTIVDAPQQEINDWMKGCLSNLDGDPRFYSA